MGCPQTPTTVLGPSAIYPWVSQQSALASSWSAKASLQRFAPMTPRVWNLPWLQLLAWCGLCLKFLADHTTSATAACCDAACPQDSPWSEPPPTGLPRKPQCGLSLDLPTARTHHNYNFAQPTMVAPVQPNPRTTNNLRWLQVHLLLAHSSSSQPAYMALVWSPSSLCPFRVQLACQIQPAHTFYKGKAPAQGYFLETWKGCCFA